MRLRQMTWSHYGIDKKNKTEIINAFRTEPEKVDELIQICGVPYGIQKNVREWIMVGTSYQKQYDREPIPITDADFYGWCRKVVAAFYSNGGKGKAKG